MVAGSRRDGDKIVELVYPWVRGVKHVPYVGYSNGARGEGASTLAAWGTYFVASAHHC